MRIAEEERELEEALEDKRKARSDKALAGFGMNGRAVSKRKTTSEVINRMIANAARSLETTADDD
jgi:hypothetical protein